MSVPSPRAMTMSWARKAGLFFCTLPIVILASGAAAARVSPHSEAAPRHCTTPDELLEKYVAALGGRDAIGKILSRKLAGTLTHAFSGRNPPRTVHDAEVIAVAPDKWRLALKTEGGIQRLGYDGKSGWIQEGARVIRDVRQSHSRLAFLFNPQGAVRIRDYFSPLGLEKRLDRQGRAEYALAVRDAGGQPLTLYFDARSGLLLRLGDDLAVTKYRRQAGVLHPVEIVITREGGTSSYLFERIEIGAAIADVQLAPPDRDALFPPLLASDDMRHDFRQLRRILEQEHCCPYEYTAREEFDALFAQRGKLLDRPLSYPEFFRIMAPLAARIGCMHTALWMPGSFFDTGADNLFPLRVKLIEGLLVVTGSYGPAGPVPAGSVILAINGVAAGEIVEALRAITSADAHNPFFIDSQIAKRFPMFFVSVFGFPEKYTVTVTMPGKEKSDTVELRPASLEAVREVVFANFSHPPLTLEFLDDRRTAVMTVRTFSYYDRVEYFRAFMEDSFRRIREKGICNLVLDLRGNDGGDAFCAVILYSYLLREPAPYFAEPYGRYAELAKPVPLPENHFRGSLYTLLDGRCGSTNGHFCSLLKYHRIGVFVGTPSGSTYRCNAGKDTEVRLDRTGMILTIGRTTFAAAVKGMDKTSPIMPDYPVRESRRDLVEGRDAWLAAVLELIAAKDGSSAD